MKNQTLILIPSPKSAHAPEAVLNHDKLVLRTNAQVLFNYAISSGDGTVVQKGVFQEEVELILKLTESTIIFQLDVFNADHHFSYNFIASGEILGD